MKRILKLIELECCFIHYDNDSNFHIVDNIKEADGIEFICPKCFELNNYERPGVHPIICWEPNVPQTINPIPGRWNLIGTSLKDLELKAGSSSILLTSGCGAHFFIRNGQIVDGNW